MSAAGTQEARALREAIVESRPRMLRKARRMLRDESAAEDAVQDALLDALRHGADFRAESRPSTWLYRVGVNAVLMGLRREKRHADRARRAAGQVPAPDGWLVGAAAAGPAERVETREQLDLLRWAIDALPEHYRLVVLRCDLAEEDPERVAAEAGLSLGGLRTRRLRAHRLLRAELESRS